MAVEAINPRDVVEQAAATLGLNDACVELMSAEGVAASIRRAAAFLCPITPRALARAVEDGLRGLPGFTLDHPELIEITVARLVAHGDLLELPVEADGRRVRQLFLGPPAFVPRRAGCFLLGVRPEGAPLIACEANTAIECRAHLRWLRWEERGNAQEGLLGQGLARLDRETWLAAPRAAQPSDVVREYLMHLEASGPAGEIEGLRVLDPDAPVRYYRGRWRAARANESGLFIARRPQAFGANLWCFVQLADGAIGHLVDLPVRDQLHSGADEAWRLQAAIDAAAGQPAVLRVAEITEGVRLDFFSPVPRWSQRRLDLIGEPAERGHGALFSYSTTTEEADEEVAFLRTMLWMTVEPEEG